MSDSVLVDTSVWVDHLRRKNAILVSLLDAGQVRVHPLVVGELACGNLAQRAKILTAIAELPKAPTIDHHRAMEFLEVSKLMGRGLGWVDVNLLASAAHGGLAFWTLDRRLATAATELKIAMT